jgi:hypothetical protein
MSVREEEEEEKKENERKSSLIRDIEHLSLQQDPPFRQVTRNLTVFSANDDIRSILIPPDSFKGDDDFTPCLGVNGSYANPNNHFSLRHNP